MHPVLTSCTASPGQSQASMEALLSILAQELGLTDPDEQIHFTVNAWDKAKMAFVR